MAHLATELLRVVTRAFYAPEYAVLVDALIHHSIAKDGDLMNLLHMNQKSLRKLCGRLRDDGLICSQPRAERRAGEQNYVGPNGKERLSVRDWYYINYHRAIDTIKFRMHELSKHMESLGLPTTERKDLSCPRCGNQYTELESMDNIDPATGSFLCNRCGHALDSMEEEERTNENESMKRLNQQLDKVMKLLQQIDAADVPENDFEQALSKEVPIVREDNNPGAKTTVVELPNHNVKSTKGLDIQPEKVVVHVQDDEDVKKERAAAEASARKAKEAAQNALPSWHTTSTVREGELTGEGYKEEQQRRLREANSGIVKPEEAEETKPNTDGDEEEVLAEYRRALAAEQAAEAAKKAEEEEDEEDDDDEDEFEDVIPGDGSTPANGVNGKAAVSTGMNTPMGESSNATDDERDTKRIKRGPDLSAATSNSAIEKPAADTPAASDEDEDEFETVI